MYADCLSGYSRSDGALVGANCVRPKFPSVEGWHSVVFRMTGWSCANIVALCRGRTLGRPAEEIRTAPVCLAMIICCGQPQGLSLQLHRTLVGDGALDVPSLDSQFTPSPLKGSLDRTQFPSVEGWIAAR